MRIILLLCFVWVTNQTFGQSLKAEIDETYNFKPSKLSKAEQQAKFPAMDRIFDKIKADTTKYLPELRKELIADGHNSYFYFDGGAFLVSLSNQFADKNLVARALVKSDLEDLDRGVYTRMLNQLANEGVDVTDAALKILDDDHFSFFIPQHVFTFDQGYSLTYMLLPQHSLAYVDRLISIFKKVSPVAQQSIIKTLWFAYSCKGDEFIKAAADDQSLTKEVRNLAKDALKHGQLNRDETSYAKTLDKPAMAKLRTDALMRFSDEAVEELELTTKVLRRDDACKP